MQIPCDTIGAAVATYLDAGDFTAASRTTYRRVLEAMARELGPGRAVAELDADQLAAWFQRTRATHGPATWNRDRVIVRSFVRHLQRQGVAVELPALEHRRVRPDTTRALPRADVAKILDTPAPLRDKTLWRMLYESAARAGEVLALDVEDLDLPNRQARVVGKGGQVEWITWSTGTATLLPRLLRSRRRRRRSTRTPGTQGRGEGRLRVAAGRGADRACGFARGPRPRSQPDPPPFAPPTPQAG